MKLIKAGFNLKNPVLLTKSKRNLYIVKAYQLSESFDKNFKLVKRWKCLGVMTCTDKKSHALAILRIWTNSPLFKATIQSLKRGGHKRG